MLKETKSNWDCVAKKTETEKHIHFGDSTSYLFLETPENLLRILNQYKFASRFFHPNSRILDITALDGVGSYLLAKSGLRVTGLFLDHLERERGIKNFKHQDLEFSIWNPSEKIEQKWDGVIILSEIFSQNSFTEIKQLIPFLSELITENGRFFIGIENKNNDGELLKNILEGMFSLCIRYEVSKYGLKIHSSSETTSCYCFFQCFDPIK